MRNNDYLSTIYSSCVLSKTVDIILNQEKTQKNGKMISVQFLDIIFHCFMDVLLLFSNLFQTKALLILKTRMFYYLQVLSILYYNFHLLIVTSLIKLFGWYFLNAHWNCNFHKRNIILVSNQLIGYWQKRVYLRNIAKKKKKKKINK